MSKIYDVIILGAGPAGLTAGLYAGRSRLSTLIIEKGQDGGQIAITDEIENYPGQIVEALSLSPSAARTRASSPVRESPSVPPVTRPSLRTSRSSWSAAATARWRRPCT